MSVQTQIAKLEAGIKDVIASNQSSGRNIKDPQGRALFLRNQREGVQKVVSGLQAQIEALKLQPPEEMVIPITQNDNERQSVLAGLLLIGGIIFLVS